MKALVMNEYMKFNFTDVPAPRCEDDGVLVEVETVGICGSDVHGFDGSTGRRLPPIIMGHEAAGTIRDIGSKVKGWVIGQRVTFDSTVFCGECEYCRTGQTNICENRQVLGVSTQAYRRNGAMAELIAVPARTLYAVPDGLTLEEASLVEPLSVATHAVRKLGIEKGSVAVVVGVGIIGQLAVQVLKHYGCKTVIAVDKDAWRLGVAQSLGADFVVNVDAEDPQSVVRRLTRDRGADYAVEAVGMSPTIATAISTLTTGGRLVLIGNISPSVEIPLQEIVTNEIQIFGTYASSGEYSDCLDLMSSGAVRVKNLISATPYLGDGEEWFKKLYNAEGELLKVVLRTRRL